MYILPATQPHAHTIEKEECPPKAIVVHISPLFISMQLNKII